MNLYVDFLELLGECDPSLAPQPPAVYAAACRWAHEGDARHFGERTHTLVVGQPLPLLPLCLAENLAVPWSWKRPMRRLAAARASRDAATGAEPCTQGGTPQCTM